MPPLTRQQLQQVANHNFLANGGFEVDDDAMRDLGIAPPDDMPEVIDDALAAQEARLKTQKAAVTLGPVACGDCLVDVLPGQSCPQGHLTVSKKGKPRFNG